MPVLDKIAAILRRDLLMAIRYRAGLSLAVAGALLEIGGLYYLARAIGPEFRPEGMQSYPFLLIGTGLYTFLVMGVSSFLSVVQEAQQAGTLEVLMTTSTSPSSILLLSATSSFAGKGFAFVMYLVAGLMIAGVHLTNVCLLPLFAVLTLSIAVASAIGIATAAIQILVHKGSAIVWVLGSAIWMLVGAMFPVSVLPRWLQIVSWLIPMTHSLSAMRLALWSGFSAGLLREITLLTIFIVVALPASLLFFNAALQRARLNGSLS